MSGVDEYVVSASKGPSWQTSKVQERFRNGSLSASSKKINKNINSNEKNKKINLNLNTEPSAVNETTKLHLNTSFSDDLPPESDCVITIKSFVSSEKENFIPDTPQSYSSYNANPRGQLFFPNRKPKTSNFNTRPNNKRGKISSLGGGFYFNTNKQSIPSAYYTYSREVSAARSANLSRPKQRQALTADILNNNQGTETKYFNISKPLIAPRPSHAFNSHSHYYHGIS